MSSNIICLQCSKPLLSEEPIVTIYEEQNSNKSHQIHKDCLQCMECQEPLTIDTAIIPHKINILLCLSDYIDLKTTQCKNCAEVCTENKVEHEGYIYHTQCLDQIPKSNPVLDAFIEELIFGNEQSQAVFKHPKVEQSFKQEDNAFLEDIVFSNCASEQFMAVEQSNTTAELSNMFVPNYMQQYYQSQRQPRSYYNLRQPPPSYLAQMIARHCNQGINQGNMVQQQDLSSVVLSNSLVQPAHFIMKTELFNQNSKMKQNLENVNPKANLKRPRVTITNSQRKFLEDMYAVKHFPNNKERRMLGMQTGMNPRQVQIWFQNVRRKDKKLGINKKPDSDILEMDASVEDALNYFEQL